VHGEAPPEPIVSSIQDPDMNAPPNIDPVTAHSDSDVMHWLTNDARDVPLSTL
jgi:hypothetical protein